MLPAESTARYQYIQIPLTLIDVSSTRHESVALFRWVRQRWPSSGAERCTRALDRGVVDIESSLGPQFFEIMIAERVPQGVSVRTAE